MSDDLKDRGISVIAVFTLVMLGAIFYYGWYAVIVLLIGVCVCRLILKKATEPEKPQDAKTKPPAKRKTTTRRSR